MPPRKKTTAPAVALPDETEAKQHVAVVLRDATETVDLIEAFDIEGQEDLDLIAEQLTSVKARAKSLDEMKMSVTRPINEALKALRAIFRPAEDKLEAIEYTIKKKIAAFHAVAAERNRLAIAEASAASIAGEDPSASIAKVASIANTEGVSVRLSWAFEITDASAVPRELCSPDMAKIKAFISECAESLGEKTPGLEIPDAIDGVRVFVHSTIAARGAA